MTLRLPAASRLRRRPAFTVIELMVAVSIMTVIVFILFKMFDQTQRAMRGNMSQTDVMEGGRAVAEMLGRELEQAGSIWDNWNGLEPRTNFFCSPVQGPFLLNLPGQGLYDLHYLDTVYFLSPFELAGRQQSHEWEATVYRVLWRTNDIRNSTYVTNLASEGVGWLAKQTLVFTNGLNSLIDPLDPTLPPLPQRLGLLSTEPGNLARFQKVLEGVVHFRVRPLNSLGQPLYQRLLTSPILEYSTNQLREALISSPVGKPPEIAYAFVGSALPAFVELELGILEPQALDRWVALPPEARYRFLTNQAAGVHYFTQRVPIRRAPKLVPFKP